MALPSSGAISLSDIQTEFGGSSPISLNEYYAGGTYVPAGTSGTYGAVPSSGAISIQNFYGTSKAVLTIPTTTQTVSTTAFKSWTSAYAGFNFDGTVAGRYYAYNSTSTSGGGVYTELGIWVTPASAAAGYEVRATTVTQSGSQTDSGNFGTWNSLNGGGPLWWILPQFYDQTVTRTITITVRNASTLATVGSFNVALSTIWYNFG